MSRFMFNSGGIGGNDQYTQVLLHFDGTNGSTTITDSNINNARTWTGTAAPLSTTQAKFGPTSLNLIGINWASPFSPNTVTLTGITYGTSDWTIDFWVYPISPTQGYSLCSHRDSGGNAANTPWLIQLNPDNSVRTFVSNGSLFYLNNSSTMVSYAQWNHLALVRSGNVFTTYINGIASGNITQSMTVPSPTIYPIIIGPHTSASEFPGNCYIDEFRLSIGVARWTSNFTPPGVAYS